MYKNLYESLNLNEILNNEGQSLQTFIIKSNNNAFKELVNK